MKLLLDQGLPRSSARLLREAGIDTIHVGGIGLSTAADTTILKRGRDEERIIVTLDADFHTLLVLSEAKSPSVIRIRIEGLRGEKLSELVQTVIKNCDKELREGAMVTVEPRRIRIRCFSTLNPKTRF